MIEKKILICLKEIFKKEKIPKNVNNLELSSLKSWDSLSHLNLLLVIEKEFKTKFTLDQMYELRTIKEIIDAIKDKKR